jgi:hypothetical protein
VLASLFSAILLLLGSLGFSVNKERREGSIYCLRLLCYAHLVAPPISHILPLHDKCESRRSHSSCRFLTILLILRLLLFLTFHNLWEMRGRGGVIVRLGLTSILLFLWLILFLTFHYFCEMWGRGGVILRVG